MMGPCSSLFGSAAFQPVLAAVRRWASGAQWAMVLSGAQSALAGGFFIAQSAQEVSAVIPLIAGYAGFGAIYFLVSALWLVLGRRARKQA